MITPDPSQQVVLELDAEQHARVLGAPGTGKTHMLVETYARLLDRSDWQEEDVLVLAPNRLAAARLRAEIEHRAGRVFGGTPVRTPVSLAFAALSLSAANAGADAPRLLTGTVQDEAIAETVEARLAAGTPGLFAPEVLRSPTFRTELREFWRVIDDFDLDPETFCERLAALQGRSGAEAITAVPDDGLLDRWVAALGVIAEVAERLRAERPEELSSSALLRAAAGELRSGRVGAPRLLLVDDAQEIGEGQLALLAACASAGSSVWAFGDPDISTETFHGERTRVMGGLAGELNRRGSQSAPEQLVVLDAVHRHGPELRKFVRVLTERIGAAGAGGQRGAGAAEDDAETAVRFATAESPPEQLGMIAHRLRSAHLGLGGGPQTAWRRMAVICRSRDEALRISRGLANHQVPTGVTAGGIVLREHRVVRDLIRLLQRALGTVAFDVTTNGAAAVQEILSGPLGGIDPVAVRRLRGALMMQERRAAREEAREARGTDELLLEAFEFPGTEPVVDSPGGRALRRLARLAAAGVRVHTSGGTPRETLWAMWSAAKLGDGTTLAEAWQHDALESRGARADEADRSLDAVMGLFFALQRHEEQASEQAIEELLEQMLDSAVPEDTLAQRGERDTVTVTTPQGTIGREFDLVAIVGVQDGAWPNLRSRGSLLGTVALERWLRGGEATEASRRDTIHDELRLLAQACSRATRELLVVAVSDDDRHPGPFFRFGREHLNDGLPSSRLTLRGATAALRRRVVAGDFDDIALDSLAALAAADAPGAHPDEWYGVLPPSTNAPLHDLGDPEQRVRVSPSQLEKAETCPLDWVVSMLGGGTSNVQMSLGTLVHHAFETARDPDPDAILAAVEREWHKLPFDAEWESQRARATAEAMVSGLADYLREFEASDRTLVGREAAFSIALGAAELRGMADRLERRETETGPEVSVVDLKTGKSVPSGPATAEHAQLMAYQLGVTLGAFAAEGGEIEGEMLNGAGLEEAKSGGARLLFVHPEATNGRSFVERAQQPLDDKAREAFVQRVTEVAEVMASASFEARVDHHCTDPYAHGECRLHIIPAVSHT